MNDMTGKGGGPSPFVNAFDHAQIDSLRYNTSQLVVPSTSATAHSGSP
jgi:hypothetical protein